MEELASKRRTENYWEPFYDPELKSRKFVVSEKGWCDDHHHDFNFFIFKWNDQFCTRLEEGTFRQCDFRGEFFHHVVFKDCKFTSCDFGLSSWKNAKFTDCLFEDCSFTQSRFEECQFRNCHWIRIGVSGNETLLLNVEFTNPSSFVGAVYSKEKSDDLRSKREHSARLQRTKLTVSRSVLRCASAVGSEEAFYDAIKCNTLQSIYSKIVTFESNYKYHLWSFYYIEYGLIKAAGWVNNWGASILKPFIVGFLIVAFFALLYLLTGLKCDLLSSFIAAVDVTLLVGYTKHATAQADGIEQAMLISNMIVGIAWYAIVVPTVINRISRVRG